MLVHLLLMRFPNGLKLRLHKTGISMHSALKEEILLMIYILSEMPTDMERLSDLKRMRKSLRKQQFMIMRFWHAGFVSRLFLMQVFPLPFRIKEKAALKSRSVKNSVMRAELNLSLNILTQAEGLIPFRKRLFIFLLQKGIKVQRLQSVIQIPTMKRCFLLQII